jgi:lipoate-protein ligase B
MRFSRQFIRRISTTGVLDGQHPPRPSQSAVGFTFLDRLVPYNVGLVLQEELVSRRLQAKAALESSSRLSATELEQAKHVASTDILLLLQHKPVYTAGRRERDQIAAAAEMERLREFGAEYYMTMRGGQTTYHGPGQLVGYPIFDLNAAEVSWTRNLIVVPSNAFF